MQADLRDTYDRHITDAYQANIQTVNLLLSQAVAHEPICDTHRSNGRFYTVHKQDAITLLVMRMRHNWLFMWPFADATFGCEFSLLCAKGPNYRGLAALLAFVVSL